MSEPKGAFLYQTSADYSSLEEGFQGKLVPDEYRVMPLNKEDHLSEKFNEDIESLLHNLNMIPEEWVVPIDSLCLVAYRYPAVSPYDTGIFLTTLPQNSKSVIDGLPGSSTECLNNRFYAGITIQKEERPLEQKVKIEKCLGNGFIPNSKEIRMEDNRANMALKFFLLNYLQV